ncbi:hypothetical protein [Pelotomaculum propionicicum]
MLEFLNVGLNSATAAMELTLRILGIGSWRRGYHQRLYIYRVRVKGS